MVVYNHSKGLNKNKIKVNKMLKKNRSTTTLYKVTWKFIEEEKIYETECTSSGFASLNADYMVEILSVEKL
jgi:hypothetical protein